MNYASYESGKLAPSLVAKSEGALWSTNCVSSLKLTRWAGFYLKGQCHESFCFLFLSWISFPPAPEYHIRTLLIFFENSRRYSQVKVHHWYQRHRRQITTGIGATGVNDTGGKFAAGVNDTGGNLPPVSTTPAANLPPVSMTPVANISGCWDLKVNLKAKMYP